MSASTIVRDMDKKVTYSNIPRKLHASFKMFAASKGLTERDLFIHCMLGHAEPFLDMVDIPWPEGFNPDLYRKLKGK